MKNTTLTLVLSLTAALASCSDSKPGDPSGGDAPTTDVVFGSDQGPGVDSLTDAGASDAGVDIGAAVDVPPDGAGGQDVMSDATNSKSGAFLVVVPEVHSFSFISPLAAPLFKQVTLHNIGAEPLTITSIGFVPGSSPDFGIVLIPPMPKTVGPNKSTMVNVRFSQGDGADGTLRIESTDPENSVKDVLFTSHIKATVNVPEPCVGLVPTQLNFGTVVRGQQKTLSATLSNCATTEPLTLTKIEAVGSLFFPFTEEFQLTPEPPTPQSLAPGQTLGINVTYTPKLAGLDSGTYEFHTNDPGEPVAYLDVYAIGVEPPAEEVALTIKIWWDADECDIDSHLLMPGGSFFDCTTDCHYGNPAPDWGVPGDWKDDPFLDVDDIDGYGPEHINISEPTPGTYRFMVHYWSDSYDDSFPTDTNTTVQVLSYGQVLAEFGPEYFDVTNRTWDVFDLKWISNAVPPTITPLGNTYVVPGSAVKACWPAWP